MSNHYMSPHKNHSFGLGDLAYWLFRPIVYFVDFVWGTDLKDCDVCKARRKRWNAVASIPRRLAVILLVTMCGALIAWRYAG